VYWFFSTLSSAYFDKIKMEFDMFLSKITRLTAFASVFFLVACGGGGSDSPASNSKTPTATLPAPVNQEQVSVNTTP